MREHRADGVGAAGASWALVSGLESFLDGVTATDPVTFWLVLGAPATVALIGGCLPARRVSRIDPMTALRARVCRSAVGSFRHAGPT